MPFRQRFRSSALRPVNRIKHVVDIQGGLIAGTQTDTNLISTTDTPLLTANNAVETGSKVNGIYLNVEAYATSAGAISNIYMAIVKNPGGNIVEPTANLIGVSDNKRFVIHQEMKMMQQVDKGNPRTIFNGVIAIPKGYRRNAPNDLLVISLLTTGVTANFCFQCHYKEFR